MDIIANLESREIYSVLVPTINAFVPLLKEHQARIVDIPKRTFKYGDTDRHQLDIYYPLETPENNTKTPILVFVYGGGFSSGARNLPGTSDLCYACLGAFFAHRGYTTVIPDYRLVPDVICPAPAEDIRDALNWVDRNPQNLGSNPDMDSFFILGHSAGVTLILTVLLHPDLLPYTAPLRSKIKGLILSCGGYHFHPPGLTGTAKEAALKYFGSEEQMMQNEPLALLEKAPVPIVSGLPRILMVEAENDQDSVKVIGADFKEALDARYFKQLTKFVAANHNHISPNLALSTGHGDEWGKASVSWMKTALKTGAGGDPDVQMVNS